MLPTQHDIVVVSVLLRDVLDSGHVVIVNHRCHISSLLEVIHIQVWILDDIQKCLRKFNGFLLTTTTPTTNKSKVKEKNNQSNDRNWMKEKHAGEEKTENNHSYKIIGKKKYCWCLHHNNKQGQWVRHQPDECHNKPNKEENKEENEQANLAASFDTEYSEDEEE